MTHKETIQLVLQQASRPLTRQEVGVACNGATTSIIQKHLRTLQEEGKAHVADWVSSGYRNSMAPRWVWGPGVDAPKVKAPPSGRRPPKVQAPITDRPMPLSSHLRIPDTVCKTTFIGENPWLTPLTAQKLR